MPFYSYALWHKRRDGDTALTNRCLIITDNRTTADQLYRGIQEQMVFKSGSVEFYDLKRLSPQMWTWGASGTDDLRELLQDINSGNSQYTTERLRRLRGKVFLEYLYNWDTNYAWSILPKLELADHVDKKTFFIRNKLVPNQFWVEGTDSYVALSTERRSKFRIEIVGDEKSQNGEDLIIVDSDRVRMSLVRPEIPGQNAGEFRLHIDESGFLRTYGQGNTEINFGAFKGGFAISSRRDGNSYPVLLDSSFAEGEKWELV